MAEEFQQFFGTARKIRLPSGAWVIARRPSTISLIASGGFPSELTSMVWKFAQDGMRPEDMAGEPELLRRMAEMMDQYVPHVLVSPTIGPVTNLTQNADGVLEGTLQISEMDDNDKRYLFFFGQGLSGPLIKEKGEVAPRDLEKFRDESASADARHGGEEIRAEAVGVARTPVERTDLAESGHSSDVEGAAVGAGDGAAQG